MGIKQKNKKQPTNKQQQKHQQQWVSQSQNSLTKSSPKNNTAKLSCSVLTPLEKPLSCTTCSWVKLSPQYQQSVSIWRPSNTRTSNSPSGTLEVKPLSESYGNTTSPTLTVLFSWSTPLMKKKG